MSDKPTVFDLDDLCPQYDPWDTLHRWKERNPSGLVTLFAIPRRCDDAFLRRYLDLPWVELAMHGYWHTTGETLYWTAEDAQTKMLEWVGRGGAPGFKAPKWIITAEVYNAAKECGFWVADHLRNSGLYEQTAVPVYVYNRRRRSDPWVSKHGHTWNTSGNGIGEAFESFCRPVDTEFRFVSEVVA